MKKYENYRLCGGIFFLLVLEARKQLKNAKDYYSGDTEDLSELNTLSGLAKILVPDLEKPYATMINTLRVNTSNYKRCQDEGGQYFNFADTAARTSFDSTVRKEYPKALNRMKNFVHTFLDVGGSMKKDERLVRALIDLIDHDDSITDETLFFTNADGSASTKRGVLRSENICLESFLLGVWHFSVLRKEGNTIGRDTFDFLCPPKNGGKREYEGRLGENFSLNFNVFSLGPPMDPPDDPKTVEPDIEFIDDYQQEYVDEMGTDENAFNDLRQQNIYNPTIFQQQGNHNVQIAHVEKLSMKDIWDDNNEE